MYFLWPSASNLDIYLPIIGMIIARAYALAQASAHLFALLVTFVPFTKKKEYVHCSWQRSRMHFLFEITTTQWIYVFCYVESSSLDPDPSCEKLDQPWINMMKFTNHSFCQDQAGTKKTYASCIRLTNLIEIAGGTPTFGLSNPWVSRHFHWNQTDENFGPTDWLLLA